MIHSTSSSLLVSIEGLKHAFTAIIRLYLDAIFRAYDFTVVAVFTILNVFKNRSLRLCIPSDDIDKTGFVAKFASDAIFAVELNLMVGINHLTHLFLNVGQRLKVIFFFGIYLG
jgi:hypothetical protein